MRNPLHPYGVSLLLVLTLASSVGARQQEQQQQQQGQQQSQTQGQSNEPQQSTEQPSQPIPAYHSPLASLAGNDQTQEPNPADVTPDTRPLSGVQDLTLGMPRTEHSFWQPSFSVMSTFDSNPLTSDSNSWATYTNFLAGLGVHRVSTNSDLAFNYLGGGTVSSDSSYANSVIEEFELMDRISFRRNILSVFDSLSYIPEAGFGYSGLGGSDLPGAGNIGLQNGFLPDQSILTSQTQRISNASIGQLETLLTPRSSLTFMGGYSLLHFFGAGLYDSGDSLFQAGYNYQISRHDTIAVLYNFSAYRYGGLSDSLNDNRVNIAYARRVTGRLAFQASGGPEFLVYHLPASETGGTGTTLSSGTKFYWSLHTALSYGLRRGSLMGSYDHSVNGGSGVLVGAVGDTVTGTLSRGISQQLGGALHFGYSRNAGVYGGGGQSYNYWFAGADIHRPLGRTLGVVLSYQFQYQGSSSSFCIGTACGDTFTRHTISISLAWHDHPIAF